ncbi:hypothetical protein SAMN00777080_1464 [Aquiflexum balticum DSM 16537]|uniref:Lipoprotein n=1 Tax=Aquiflexum balticum DSM 16537 TaxID=758820 RepID=A0A1W2H334_9BACT|nr:hypothetical protein [Aquiflexum balticum]SMD42896.1 hypothetical protein SAMN00777080_1464 [Aquiflexum balticum DSM 16537]
MKKTIFYILFGFSIFGCNISETEFDLKNLSEDQEDFILSKVKVENNMLSVESEADLSEVISHFSKLTIEEYMDFVRRTKGFESFQLLFEDLVDLENEESDKLFEFTKKYNIQPEKVHDSLPIHSQKVIPYIELLYFYPGGGFVPLAEVLYPGIELLINIEGKVLVGRKVLQFKNNRIYEDGIELKDKESENFKTIPNYFRNSTVASGKYRTSTDVWFNTEFRELNNEYGPYNEHRITGGGVRLRNFRQGFFGWNTRKTTELKIQGDLEYLLAACSSQPPLAHWSNYHTYYNQTKTSNGANVTSITWNFVLPHHGNWIGGCSPSFDDSRARIAFDLTITGENNNVSPFKEYIVVGFNF